MNTNNDISLSIFFPAYNEAANIEHSVYEADAVLQSLNVPYEIIIVDDGSSDDTPAIADRLAAENNRVKVVHHRPNRGYGAALWSGIQAARYRYIFFTDADLQFDLSELAILMHFVPAYQVVLGYRAPRRDPWPRLLNAGLWNILNRFLFGLKVKDIDCAFKLMDRELVAGLPIKTRGAMMSAELLIRLQRKGVVFKEIPVSHFPRTEGAATGAKLSVIVRALKELIKLYRGRLGAIARRQFMRFIVIGVINTGIDLGMYVTLTRTTDFFSHHFLFAKALSFGAGTIFSFFANRRWTFKKTVPLKAQELVKFYLTVGVGLGLNLLSLSLFLSVFHLYDIIAVIGATLVTFLWNFAASKLWVFAESVPLQLPLRRSGFLKRFSKKKK